MKGTIEVEIGIKVKDVPPKEVEAFLLAFARIARNSDGVMNLNPETQKVIAGLPAVQKALNAAPEETDGVREAEEAVHKAVIVRRTETRAEMRRETAERRAEAVAVRRMEREDARIAHLAEKEKLLTEKNKAERVKVEIALKNAHFSVVDAAEILDMTPSGLYMKMDRLGLYTRKSRKLEGNADV